MALKIAIVRTCDDTGKVDELTLPDGTKLPAVLFDADLSVVLEQAVRALQQDRPGPLRPVLRRAHDQAFQLATQAVLNALAATEQKLKQQTVNLT